MTEIDLSRQTWTENGRREDVLYTYAQTMLTVQRYRWRRTKSNRLYSIEYIQDQGKQERAS